MSALRKLATAGATAALVGAGIPAHAVIVDAGVDTVNYAQTAVCDFGTASTDDDIEILVEGVGEIRYKVKERRPGGPLYWSGHGAIHETYTNLATGVSWSSDRRFYEHDSRVLETDGNLITMLVTVANRFTVYDPTGDVDGFGRGRFSFTFVVDTKGTEDPEDDEADFGELIKIKGANTGGEFCDDAVRFTTG